MKIVICGSLSNKALLLNVEEELNKLFPGSNIITPVNEVRQEKSLLDIQKEYIVEIEAADLVVVIPKHVKTMRDGGQDMLFTFGESTTYEMALAHVHTKPVMIWKDW